MNKFVPETPDHDDSVEAIAAAWIAQRDEGFTEAQAAEFALWKNSDPKHAAAVAAVEKTYAVFEKMPLLRTDPKLSRDLARLEQQGRLRGKLIPLFSRIGIAAAAACLALAIGVWQMRPSSDDFAQSYTTTSQGYQRVTLPDESVVTLNNGTDIHVRFSATERHVTLVEGEAHFTVAENPSRPFVVNVGKIAVRAVGTAFNVRLAQESVEVLVTHGKVQIGKTSDFRSVATSPAPSEQSAVYKVGQRVIVPVDIESSSAPVVVNDDAIAIQKRLSWQASRLVFMETPLSEVVEQFNRRNQVQLSIGDPGLAARPVGGSFRADQVESFVQLLKDNGEISVERPDPKRIVLRAIR